MTPGTRKDGSQVRVHVAAFGKHPGWDDHIEEIGLDSSVLVNAKRVLYAECIGGNIDSGVWEKLEEAKRLPFKHSFFWRTGENGGLLVGRLWASRDGKGRTKYPMIVCAHVEGVPESWAVPQCLQRLKAVEEKCSQTASAELVRLAIGEARRSLEDAAALLIGEPPAQDSGAVLVQKLVTSAGVATAGQDPRLGMAVVLYAAERELSEFQVPSGWPRTKTRMGEPAAQHLRVPRGLDGPGEAVRAWAALLDQEVSQATPVLVLEPDGERFVDLIVGSPKAGQLRCLRSGEKDSGLTSDVPYNLDAQARAQLDAKLGEWAAGRANQSGPKRGAVGDAVAAVGGGPKLKWAIAGAAVLLLIVVLYFALRPGHSSGAEKIVNAPSSQAEKPAPEAPPAAPQSESPAPATQANAPTAPAPSPSGQDAADPRAAWGIDQALDHARQTVSKLGAELKAEGKDVAPGLNQKLDDAAQRAQTVRSAPWRPASADSISRDVASVSAQVADAQREADAGLDQVASRIASFLQTKAKGGTFQTDAGKKAWAAGLQAIDPRLGWDAAKSKAAATEAAVTAAETALAGVSGPELSVPAGSSIDEGALRAAVRGRRDQAVDAAANAGAAGDSARVQQEVQGLNDWNRNATALLKDATALEAGLASADAPAIADLAGKVRSSPVYRDLSSAVLPVEGQVERLKSIAGQTKTDELLRIISESAGRSAVEVAAAWSRLAQLGYGATPGEVEEALPAAERVKAAVGLVSDSARRAALSGRVAGASNAIWAGLAAKSGTTDEGIAAVQKARAGFGLTDQDVAKLPAWCRYNLARYSLVHGFADAKGGDARRAAVQGFVGAVDQLGTQVASDPRVAPLLEQARASSKGEELSFAKLGPGKSGWTAAASEDGSTVTYSLEKPGSTATKLAFRRLSSGAFLCTTELSVGQFIDAVSGAGKWDDVRPLMFKSNDARHGPRAWEWSTRAGQVMSICAAGPGDTSNGWLQRKSTTRGMQYYPQGMAVPPPSLDSPMQYVSAGAAMVVARMLGCRLPTSAEWQAALSTVDASSPTPNLRDPTWRRKFEHISGLASNDPEYPAGDIFWPKDAQKTPTEKDGVAAVEQDDSALWFLPVKGSGAGFQNLVGNVAEWVWEDAASLETMDPAAAKASSLIRGGTDRLRVIGGSALSPKEVDPRQPQNVNVDLAPFGYSDVGFRLAFSVLGEAVASGSGEKLKKAVEASGYLTPAK